MNKIVPVILVFFFINGLFVATVNPVSASGLVENSWNTKTPMDLENVSFSNGLDTVVVAGKIYAMGGSQFGSGGINECYNPVVDTWTVLKTHPDQKARVTIVAFQDKIYCIDSITPGGVIEVYDIATDNWSSKSSMPNDVASISQAYVIGKEIFVLTTPLLLLQNPITYTWYNRCIIHLYVYDPVNEQCIERASVPFPFHHYEDCVSVVMDNKIMVFGSFFTGTTLTAENDKKEYKVLVYDLKTDKWSEIKSDVPNGLGFSVAETTTGLYAPQKVYFFLSTQDDYTTSIGWSRCTYVYDPLDNTWLTAKPMPAPIDGTYGVAVVDDIFYVIGEGRNWYDSGSYNREYMNLQYVPIGYHDTPTPATSPPSATPESSNTTTSKPTDSSEPNVTYLIVVTVTLTLGTTGALFFYFKKRKRGNTGDISNF